MTVRTISFYCFLLMVLVLSAGSQTEDSSPPEGGSSSSSSGSRADQTEEKIQEILSNLPEGVHKTAEELHQSVNEYIDQLPSDVRDNAEDLQQQIQGFLDGLFLGLNDDLDEEETGEGEKDGGNGSDEEEEEEEEHRGIGDAISGLFQMGAEALGLSGGDSDNSNSNSIEGEEGEHWWSGTGTEEAYDYIKEVFTFNTDNVHTNISKMGGGMEEVAAYFGVDVTDQEQMDRFVQNFGSCKFCDTDDIDPNLQFLGLDCSDWLMFSLLSEQEECAVLRAIALEHCGCQTKHLQIQPTAERCNLCSDGSLEGVTLEKRIPTMSNELSCEDINYIAAVEGNKTCAAVAGYDYICGCPEAEPKCHLCPGGDPPSRPDAVIRKMEAPARVARYAGNPNYIPPEEDVLTCASFAEHLTMNTPSTCSFAIHVLEKETGLAIPSYCGCPNANPGGCEPCPLGYQLIQENLEKTTVAETEVGQEVFDDFADATCLEWATQFAPHLKDETQCHQLQHDMKWHCCEPIPTSPPSQQAVEEEEEEEYEDLALNDTVIAAALKVTSSATTPAPSMDLVSWTAQVPLAIILVVAFVR